MKHYSIDNKNKVITATIARLTDKEMAEIQRYVAFGYLSISYCITINQL